MSQQERTGWRDQWFSAWHRTIGRDAPMIDIDCVEYDQDRPVALIDIKHVAAMQWYRAGSSPEKVYRCIAEALNVPFWIIYYDPDTRRFSLRPLNRLAREITDDELTAMDERAYIELLYRLRGRELPSDLEMLLRAG